MTQPRTKTGPSLEREEKRLTALRASGLLDSAPEEEFDEVARLAAFICGVPTSLISLVDEHRQWFKSNIGLLADGKKLIETPRSVSFCGHAIEQDDLFIVPDALLEPRFSSSPLVTGPPHIRFYAGYPLSTDTGEKLGTLCVVDSIPRELNEAQQQALQTLARQVMTKIQLKREIAALAAAARDKAAVAIETDLLTRRLAERDACFRGFMDASPAASFIKDSAGRIVYCNLALTCRHNALPEDWQGKDDYEIWPHEFAEQYRAADLAVLENEGVIHFHEDSPAADGRLVSWSVYKFPFTSAEGERFIAGVALDISKEREAEQELLRSQEELRELNLKLHKLSLTDSLTKVKNRRGLEDSLEREFYRSHRTQSPLSMLMLDVDHFKRFNDAYGHVAGDQVLQRIARLMKEHSRKSDIVARYGGEEFVAVLPDTSEAEALHVSERLCQSIANYDWDKRQITVSIGVGTLPPSNTGIADPSDFLKLIDQALYAAKHNGRNQVSVACDFSSTFLSKSAQTQKGRPKRRPSTPSLRKEERVS